MRKYRKSKYILFSIILLFLIVLRVDANEVKKGDLRCPPFANNCTEIKNSSDEVREVNIVYNEIDGDKTLQVTKNVKKTDELGVYDVQFTINGKNISQTKTANDVYIVILFDASKTMENKVDSAQKAIKRFAKELIPTNDGTSNFYISVVNFAKENIVSRDFSNSNLEDMVVCGKKGQINCFCSYKNDKPICSNIGKKSHVEDAFTMAYNLLHNPNISAEAQKYVILFGDGRYWDNDDTDIEYVKPNASKLKDAGVKIFGIRYAGTALNELVSKNSARFAGCYNNRKHGICDQALMKQLTTTSSYPYYQDASNVTDYTEFFLQVANSIKNENNIYITNYSSNLLDRLGANFYLVSNNLKYKNFNIGKISETGYKTEVFKIRIDQDAEKGWHDTNNGFTFTYTDGSGVEKVIHNNENPQVYWYPPVENIEACIGISEIPKETIIGNEYYNITCNDIFYYNINVNNTVLSDKKEEINSFDNAEFGFPVNVLLKSNVRCIYKFNKELYKKEYNEIVNSLNTTNDSKEIASLTVRKNELDKTLDTYINTINNFDSYINSFTNQKARMMVTYSGTSVVDNIDFINNNVNSDLDYVTNLEEVINGKKIIIDGRGDLSISKEMILENICLEMKNGEQITCNSESTNQILGGNNFYANLKYNSGKVSVSIPNAGYSGKINIELKDCSFSSGNIDVLYRQIDVNDPFLRKFNTEKRIGKNFLNLDYKYDFTKMITDGLRTDKNTWQLDSDYKYTLSKNNINNIRKNTESVNDYLGSNCYFNNDNKYICDFTRNTLNNSSGELFTNVVLNKQ